MSNEIETHRVQRFFEGITILAQQKMSRLRPLVRQETVKAKIAFFDQIGQTSMIERTTRHTDTPLIEIEHRRRSVTMKFFHTADLVDEADIMEVINDPTSSYGLVMAMAAGRTIDDEIQQKFFATAKTGETGGDTAVHPTSHQIASGSDPMTIGKLLAAKRILDESEEDPTQKRHAGLSAKQIEDMLNTTEVASSDFNTVKALAMGELNSFAGFNFVRYEGFEKSGNDRLNPFWVESSMLMAMGQDIKGRVSERDDKDYSTQIYYSLRVGCTRMNETGVVRVANTE